MDAMKLIHKYRYYILAFLYISTLLLFWPGIAMHDSNIQYQQAVNGQYSDHHPPIMAFIWHYLDLINAGSGLMFDLQITFLYSACFIFLKTSEYLSVKKPWLPTLLLLILPIYPQILIYELVITKDAQFATSLVLSGAILAYYTITNKDISLAIFCTLLLLLLYAAACKYQGKYVVIIFAVWLGFLLNQRFPTWRRLSLGLGIYVLLFVAVFAVNNFLTVRQNRSYAWQYVKLYDLAAISVIEGKDLIPDFNKTANYSMVSLHARFSYPAVDSLVFKNDPLLKITRDSDHMSELCKVWRHTVATYPGAYIKHRVNNMRYMLLARTGFYNEAQDVPIKFINDLNPENISYYVIDKVAGILFYIFMSGLPVALLGVGYFILALIAWHRSKAAQVLAALTGTALLMILLLFVMSMAGTPRYIYVSIILIHSAHTFAYAALRDS